MARNTPPSIVQYAETASWITGAASKVTSTSLTWQTGDVIVFAAICEGVATIAVPTATGLTFTSQKTNAAASSCASRLATAVAASSGSGAVTATNTSSVLHWGFACWVLRGSDGVGVSAEQHTTTHTVSALPTDTHSAWLVACGDFSAAVVTGNSITPTVTTSRQKAQDASHYSFYVGEIADQASAASTPYGLTAGGTTGAISILAMEVLGTTVVAAGRPPASRMLRGQSRRPAGAVFA